MEKEVESEESEVEEVVEEIKDDDSDIQVGCWQCYRCWWFIADKPDSKTINFKRLCSD